MKIFLSYFQFKNLDNVRAFKVTVSIKIITGLYLKHSLLYTHASQFPIPEHAHKAEGKTMHGIYEYIFLVL